MSQLSSLHSGLPTAPTTVSAPHLRAVPTPPDAPALPAASPAGALPAGATVLGAWPSGLLPEQLLRQAAGSADAPMVGYLVLVPAGEAQPFATPPVWEAPAEPDTEAGGPGLRLDLERRTAEVDGRLLDLTYLEFELLAHLTAHPRRVHTRDHLVTAVWGYGHVGDGRTVDVHVARLRRKLGAEYRGSIVTIRRVGYKYVPRARARLSRRARLRHTPEPGGASGGTGRGDGRCFRGPVCSAAGPG
jgi:DNA-binding winged helix-turn-helix (wHTH) protein